MTHRVSVITNTATACGELILNGGPLPKVCDTDDETVAYTPPPPVVTLTSDRRSPSRRRGQADHGRPGTVHPVEGEPGRRFAPDS